MAPYLAVGLSTVVYGVGERKHIGANLDTVEDGIHAAMSMIGINMPVKLIALAEGALTGFTDEAFDIPHVVAAHDLFIDIPGPESERLAALARHYETYLVVQCKARWPEVMPNRYFNTLFVISPKGEVVHKAAKNHLWCRERSCTPHDVYDRWVELFGDGIDAFFPVLRTEDIGNLGTICCSDGEYPEAVRALAFNGAEVVYRPSEAVPMTNWGSEPGGTWVLQNRAHAHFNTVYMLCPNVGPVYLHPRMQHPYRHRAGQLARRRLPRQRHLLLRIGLQHVRHRDHRHRGAAPVPGHEPQLELDEGPAHRDLPAHVRGADPPRQPLARGAPEEPRAGRRGLPRQHPRLIERGTYTPPAHSFPGARYIPMDDAPPMQGWLGARTLWDDVED